MDQLQVSTVDQYSTRRETRKECFNLKYVYLRRNPIEDGAI